MMPDADIIFLKLCAKDAAGPQSCTVETQCNPLSGSMTLC